MALTFRLGLFGWNGECKNHPSKILEGSWQKTLVKKVKRYMAQDADQKCKIERVNDMKFDAFFREVLKNPLKKQQSIFGRSSFLNGQLRQKRST